jgi:hypothetical protein
MRLISSYRDRIDLRSFFSASFFASCSEMGVSSRDESVTGWSACFEADLYLELAQQIGRKGRKGKEYIGL